MSLVELGPYRALGLDFVVDVHPAAVTETARTLSTVPHAPPGTLPAVRFSIIEQDDRWILREGDRTILHAQGGLERIERFLVTQITRRSLDHTPDLLHIHAGTVAHEGRGLMVYGPSLAGKSTTVAALVRAGCPFLSDESAAIDPESARVRGWPKPLSLRRGALELLGLVEPGDDQTGSEVPLQHPATDLGPGGVITDVQVSLVLELAYEPGAETSLAEVHPADAAVHLASNTLDLPRFGRGGVALMGQLAAGARCARLTHSMAPAQAAEYLIGLAEEGSAEPLTVESLPRSTPRPAAPTSPITLESRPQPNRHVDAALIGTRVALHDLRTSQAAALDDVGSLIWLHLDGETSLATVADLFDAPEARDGVLAFVAELAGQGLLV